MYIYSVIHDVHTMSSVMVVRLPDELRDEMRKHRLNWSEEVRKAIIARLLQLKREEGYREMDRIRASLKGREFDGAGEVARWRRRRWSLTPR
jgi:hypothetical protein